MTWLPAASVIITILISVIGVTRHISKKDSDVDAVKAAVVEVNKRIDKVEHKADGTDKEVTGPHNMRAVKLAADVAHVGEKLDALSTIVHAFFAEYRSDQKGKRS